MNGLGEALKEATKRLDGDGIFNLILLGILAWVVVKLGPHVLEAYVKDRESRRRHHERMAQFNRRMQRRRK
ncbi:hypothetical protein DRB17_17990 [Ferruginivarius sediminum]|uniref:Uncharacterized protein n=1 Tax=Ferruginivarius sediminum TaxID=2661937 RepID=A0A369T587_9PROT|nr:hypothetical protein DRB17_17990 [Ferruginivarius sediminum]